MSRAGLDELLEQCPDIETLFTGREVRGDNIRREVEYSLVSLEGK